MNNILNYLGKINLPFLNPAFISFDLGSCNSRIAIKDKGIVLRDASYIGFNKRLKEYVFFGNEAKKIIGKVPSFIRILKPVIHGVISDFDAQVCLVNKFLSMAIDPYFYKNKFIKPPLYAVASVPTIATEIEQKAVEEVLFKTGFSKVFIIEKPNTTAVGAGFNVFSHQPTFIADLGGGLIEMSILSGGGIIVQKTLKTAGHNMNKLIANYLYLKHGIILGEKTCENLKIDLLNFNGKEETVLVRGKSLETGLPKSIRVKSADVKEALMNSLHQIIDCIKELIELCPPELINEILSKGIVLTGGLANIKGIDLFLSQETKMKVVVGENPEETTIRGLLKLSKNIKDLFRLSINS